MSQTIAEKNIQNPMVDGDESEDLQLITRGITPEELRKLASGSYRLEKKGRKKPLRKRFTEIDSVYLEFMLKMRWATATDLQRLHSHQFRAVTWESTRKRLLDLRNAGLVKQFTVYNSEDFWTLTKKGASFLGEERWKEPKAVTTQVVHAKFLNSLAVSLVIGDQRILSGPGKKRMKALMLKDISQLSSEYEIQSSLGYMRGSMKSAELRTALRRELADRFAHWTPGDADPAHERGEEWASTLFPAFNNMGAYHVPDLVVKNRRPALDSPCDIAIEFEASTKPQAEYKKILQKYASDFLAAPVTGKTFGAVIWICRHEKAATRLRREVENMPTSLRKKVMVVRAMTPEGEVIPSEGAFWRS